MTRHPILRLDVPSTDNRLLVGPLHEQPATVGVYFSVEDHGLHLCGTAAIVVEGDTVYADLEPFTVGLHVPDGLVPTAGIHYADAQVIGEHLHFTGPQVTYLMLTDTDPPWDFPEVEQ